MSGRTYITSSKKTPSPRWVQANIANNVVVEDNPCFLPDGLRSRYNFRANKINLRASGDTSFS